MEIPNLLPNQAEVVGNLGTPDLDLASEVGASPVGLSPQPVGSDAISGCQRQIELNGRTPSLCHRKLLVVGKNLHTFGAQKCQK